MSPQILIRLIFGSLLAHSGPQAGCWGTVRLLPGIPVHCHPGVTWYPSLELELLFLGYSTFHSPRLLLCFAEDRAIRHHLGGVPSQIWRMINYQREGDLDKLTYQSSSKTGHCRGEHRSPKVRPS